ncbi:putative glycosylphosphatidylinositol-alpha 1,2 mannosyltransferase Ecym_3374 [Eremothecium cymbalariae DBVPG|uniref:Mannosyltransferase n=1 Tax=Eremothecium cymbalariae (strain CBS 270.75 / DBVPG 7215 / KCTC 17166 / NRRL Y-17582) TaxID=931890 RepID=G8JRU2_ERECY|nr:Hypothetical protein Ecym_3374 [Eremothecium cymbalariae DBVPG\
MRVKDYLKVLVIWRMLNAFFTRSYFQPDEFWQTLEPAHVKAFGYGELTWEWKIGLRSYAFPLLFEIVYYFVQIVSWITSKIVLLAVFMFSFMKDQLFPENNLANMMYSEMVTFPEEVKNMFEYYGTIYGPKFLMALMAAIGEFYTVLLVRKMSLLILNKSDDNKGNSNTVCQLTVLLTLTNFFNCFFITRTFINSFEMILTSIALYYWDWSGGDYIRTFDFTKSVLLALFICLQRPTGVLIWGLLGLLLTLNLVHAKKWSALSYLYAKVVVLLLLITAINAAIDFYFYGELVFPILRFVKFNFTSSLSIFYGKSPWNFHLIQSLPLILGYNIPFFMHSLYLKFPISSERFRFINPIIQFKAIIFFNVLFYSLIAHKEFRFLYPLQPFLITLTTLDCYYWIDKYYPNDISRIFSKLKWYWWILPTVAVFSSLVICAFNESGTILVMEYLHFQPKAKSVGFVMPCHSTPWQSYLHRNDIDDLWAITCDPPLHLLQDSAAIEKLGHYMDESDHLYDDIVKFIYTNFPPVFREDLRTPGREYAYEWPEYLIIFEHLDNIFMKDFLMDSQYQEVTRFFNTLQHWDSRRRGDVIVYHKRPLI